VATAGIGNTINKTTTHTHTHTGAVSKLTTNVKVLTNATTAGTTAQNHAGTSMHNTSQTTKLYAQTIRGAGIQVQSFGHMAHSAFTLAHGKAVSLSGAVKQLGTELEHLGQHGFFHGITIGDLGAGLRSAGTAGISGILGLTKSDAYTSYVKQMAGTQEWGMDKGQTAKFEAVVKEIQKNSIGISPAEAVQLAKDAYSQTGRDPQESMRYASILGKFMSGAQLAFPTMFEGPEQQKL